MAKHNPIGSSFEDFLREEGILEEVETKAIKELIAEELEETRKQQGLTKTELAAKMGTSRAALNRLLDPSYTAVTLNTLEKAASVLGKRLRLQFL